jgi:hypothetical protein
MKKASDKMVGAGDASTKSPSALVCVQECVVIGAGTFMPGDRVTDRTVLKLIAGNPNFAPAKQEA